MNNSDCNGSTRDSESYEIGFGKPPKESRFKPGKSGNPSGRPKGSKNRCLRSIAELVRAESNREIVVTENGRRKKITVAEAAVRRMCANAIKGQGKGPSDFLKICKESERWIESCRTACRK